MTKRDLNTERRKISEKKKKKLNLETFSHNQWKILVISPVHTKSSHIGKILPGSPGNLFKASEGCRIRSQESRLQEQGAAVSDLGDRR